uniref:Uncharacterized protein n=1 Tax=Cacopsylla melanoneura TaxID=428564 RepID=A0A8D8YHZ9_9HEMI
MEKKPHFTHPLGTDFILQCNPIRFCVGKFMRSFENWYPYVFWIAGHEFQLCQSWKFFVGCSVMYKQKSGKSAIFRGFFGTFRALPVLAKFKFVFNDLKYIWVTISKTKHTLSYAKPKGTLQSALMVSI